MRILNPQKRASSRIAAMEMNFWSLYFGISVFLLITSCEDSLATPKPSLRSSIPKSHFTPTSYSYPCLTPECFRAGRRMLNYMDRKVEPCDNFYDFACGNFLKKPASLENRYHLDVQTFLSVKINFQMKDIIEETSPPGEPKPITMAKKLYQSCMDTTAIEKAGLKKTSEILGKLGGWPVLSDNWDETTFDWIKLNHNSAELGYPTAQYFGHSFERDLENTTKRVIYISTQSGFLKHENLVENDKLNQYFEYMVDMAVIYGANRTKAEEELRKSLDLEIELVKISESIEEVQNLRDIFHPMTLKDLEGNYSSIPWRRYFKMNLEPHIEIIEDETILFVTSKYFEKLGILLENTPKRTQANYLIWGAVMETAPYLTLEIKERYMNFSGLERIPKWSQCLDIVSSKLGYGTSALYVRKHSSKNTKTSVMGIAQGIQRKFAELLQEVDWLDDGTKLNALAKVEAITKCVAYPDELLDDQVLSKIYENLEITSGDFLQSILNTTIANRNDERSKSRKPVSRSDCFEDIKSNSIEVEYGLFHNQINIPAGILQEYVFNESRPQYMNFATIGSVIGHEIIHGFDGEGITFDGEGNMLDWWDPETKRKFSEKFECLIHHYGNYTAEEVGLNVNGTSTLGENIADIGGMKVAYWAYQDWVKQHEPEHRLPGLYYSTSQLFWISAAQMWCNKYEPESLKKLITTDEHSPNRFRVLGPFSNSPEFAKDFNCPLGSQMNPAKKCSVW